jgi:hypothetical protein
MPLIFMLRRLDFTQALLYMIGNNDLVLAPEPYTQNKFFGKLPD